MITNNSGILFEAVEGTTIEGFFDFLATDPKAGGMSYIYYTYPAAINVNLEGRGKNAVPNPMYSKNFGHGIIFKSLWYNFNFGYTFQKAMLKINPDYKPADRNYSLTKHLDLRYVESGPKGDYFNIVPNGAGSSVYAIFDESKGVEGFKDPANYKIIDFNRISQYFPPRREYEAPVDYRKFFVSRTYRIAAGNHVFKNPGFEYVYFGEEPNR
jgi:hypothetical protein